jgi:16S rRNA (guanine1207-N2)-methyltransferase
VRLHVDSGVFSGSRVDLGTSVLLDAGLGVRAGTLLDLGCGYGPIALWLAQEEPTATVWGVDVNERALSLARRNAEACGVADRVRCVLPDGVPPDVCFDQIWSNPPVRIGKQALHELLAHWLPRLRPGGQAHLVVARNLGADSLAGWLRTSGWDVARVGSRKGYRLLSVERTDGRPRVF